MPVAAESWDSYHVEYYTLITIYHYKILCNNESKSIDHEPTDRQC